MTQYFHTVHYSTQPADRTSLQSLVATTTDDMSFPTLPNREGRGHQGDTHRTQELLPDTLQPNHTNRASPSILPSLPGPSLPLLLQRQLQCKLHHLLLGTEEMVAKSHPSLHIHPSLFLFALSRGVLGRVKPPTPGTRPPTPPLDQPVEPIARPRRHCHARTSSHSCDSGSSCGPSHGSGGGRGKPTSCRGGSGVQGGLEGGVAAAGACAGEGGRSSPELDFYRFFF